MSAWGRTSRVTVVLPHGYRYWSDVRVDGVAVGRVGKPTLGGKGWKAERGDDFVTLPSRDAAILWVLRRTNPALWRQERGEVWRVRTYKYARGWHAIDPQDGQCQGCLRDFPSTIARAHDLATRRAATR